MTRPLLHTIARAAVEATGAARGWLLAVDGNHLRVVAAQPHTSAAGLLGARVPIAAGVAGYVVSSGQPLALRPCRDTADVTSGLEGLLGAAAHSVVCVPCESDGAIVGALQLVDRPGGFSFDDVEVVTLLGDIAGSALAEGSGPAEAPHPGQLGQLLEQLAGTDPSRYATVAPVVEALLAHG